MKERRNRAGFAWGKRSQVSLNKTGLPSRSVLYLRVFRGLFPSRPAGEGSSILPLLLGAQLPWRRGTEGQPSRLRAVGRLNLQRAWQEGQRDPRPAVRTAPRPPHRPQSQAQEHFHRERDWVGRQWAVLGTEILDEGALPTLHWDHLSGVKG